MEWAMMFTMLIMVLLYMAHVNKSLVTMLRDSFHELAGEIRQLRIEVTKLHYAIREGRDDESSIVLIRSSNQPDASDMEGSR